MKLRIPRLRGRGRELADNAKSGTTGADGAGAPVAAGSILRGYGPLAAFALMFVLMAGLVPTVNADLTAAGGTGGAGDPGAEGLGGGLGGPAGDDDDDDDDGDGGGGEGGSAAAPLTVGGGDGSSGADVQAREGRGEGSCAGKDRQVPGDPYSPRCIEFAGGDNGGATHQGVTAEKITVSFRVIDEKGFNQTLATLAGAEIVDTPSDIRRTVEALEEFFNAHYQFYGREIEIAFHNGSSSSTCELLGGCRAEAQADAKNVDQEIGAFLEMNCASEPFCDALYQQEVMNFGTPYLSRKWHNDRRPYSWSLATDCSIVSEVAAELAVNTLAGKKAQWAAGNLAGNDRVLAGLSPVNSWYQVCHDNAIDLIRNAGHDPGLKINYKLDINSMSNQAANVVAQLVDGGATTVLCGCDPIWPVFLSSKAAEQGYQPEWVVVGTALTDWDVAAQLYDQDQWSRAFGVSSLGEPTPIRAGLGYQIYKSIREDEPAFAVELIYGTMLLVSTGIQLAGPNLNPNSFEAGLKSWQGGSGPLGTFGFGAEDYSPTRDYRIIYWDTEAISIVNSQPGAYITAYDKQRFPPGNLPTGDLQVFEND